ALLNELDTALGGPAGEMRLEDGRWLRVNRSTTTEDGFVIIAGDITMLKERQSVLEAAKEAAEAGNPAKTTFPANMSQQLRTPLNAIIGFSEIIAGEFFGPVGTQRYQVCAQDIVQSGRHLLAVINNILDIAKLQSGKTKLSLSLLRVQDIVREAMRMIRPQ